MRGGKLEALKFEWLGVHVGSPEMIISVFMSVWKMVVPWTVSQSTHSGWFETTPGHIWYSCRQGVRETCRSTVRSYNIIKSGLCGGSVSTRDSPIAVWCSHFYEFHTRPL